MLLGGGVPAAQAASSNFIVVNGDGGDNCRLCVAAVSSSSSFSFLPPVPRLRLAARSCSRSGRLV